MLLSEEPAAVIRRTINEFSLQSEKLGVAGVAEMCSTLQEVRALRVRDAEETLRKLARQLHTLSSRHDELVSSTRQAVPHTDHASRIATLDTQKFRTAKAASDAEAEAERLAGQAADLTARLQELELQGVDGEEEAPGRRRDPVDDEVLLRLKLYRSLGIDIERDGRDGAGEWTRAVVRNDRKADVHVVNLDKKVSRFFYANYFWQTL